MVKSQLLQTLAARHQLPKDQASRAVDTVLEAIQTTLANGDRVELRGFGSFSVKRYPARSGRNPKTGAPVEVPERKRVVFKAGKELRERVDR